MEEDVLYEEVKGEDDITQHVTAANLTLGLRHLPHGWVPSLLQGG
jgi:hypothetical protein